MGTSGSWVFGEVDWLLPAAREGDRAMKAYQEVEVLRVRLVLLDDGRVFYGDDASSVFLLAKPGDKIWADFLGHLKRAAESGQDKEIRVAAKSPLLPHLFGNRILTPSLLATAVSAELGRQKALYFGAVIFHEIGSFPVTVAAGEAVYDVGSYGHPYWWLIIED